VRTQRLRQVCNGLHICDLGGSGLYGGYVPSPADIEKAMKLETKAIMIVGHGQGIRRVLQRLSKKRSGLRAKLLCPWSTSADLWIVRKEPVIHEF
jgi:hypothetical protein